MSEEMIRKQGRRRDGILFGILLAYGIGIIPGLIIVHSGSILLYVVITVLGLALLLCSFMVPKLRKYFKYVAAVSYCLLMFAGFNVSGLGEMPTAVMVVMVALIYEDRKYVAIMSGLYAAMVLVNFIVSMIKGVEGITVNTILAPILYCLNVLIILLSCSNPSSKHHEKYFLPITYSP